VLSTWCRGNRGSKVPIAALNLQGWELWVNTSPPHLHWPALRWAPKWLSEGLQEEGASTPSLPPSSLNLCPGITSQKNYVHTRPHLGTAQPKLAPSLPPLSKTRGYLGPCAEERENGQGGGGREEPAQDHGPAGTLGSEQDPPLDGFTNYLCFILSALCPHR
jgi:hypothetical protein